jgi:hypothetical protein
VFFLPAIRVVGVMTLRVRSEFVTRRVTGAAVDYTPAAGFTGTNSLTFGEISLDHRDTVFRIATTVR